MRQIILSSLILILMLATCTVSETERQTSHSADTVSVPAANRPVALVANAADDQFRLTGKQIDPATLADLPAETAIDFGHHNLHTLSPDGRTLALISWPSGYNENGSLTFIDWLTWQEQPTEITIDAYVSAMQFSDDNHTLFWTQPVGRDPAQGTPVAYELHRYDLDQQQVTAVLPLPKSFYPETMQWLSTSAQLAIYGASMAVTDVRNNIPRLLLIDQTAENLAADIPLLGVTAGQYRLENRSNKTPYRMARPGLAWDQAQNLLYIAHAAEDKMTVVDLTTAEISRQVDIEARLSPLEHLLSWGVQVAEAKLVPGTDKQALLSPDGRHLYIVGLYRELNPVEGEKYGWTWHEMPLGLQVINTADLTEEQVLDLPVTHMALSPAAQWLLLSGATDETNDEGDLESHGYGLYLVNTEKTAVTTHLLPESDVRLLGFSADSRYAYVSTISSEWPDGQKNGNFQETLYAVDLSSGKITAERTLDTYFLEMIP